MRMKGVSLSGHHLAGTLALIAVTALLATPVSLEAQCSYCAETSPGVEECGYPTGSDSDRCEGGTGTECFECQWFASMPSDLAPDGSLAGADSGTPEAVAFADEQLSDGVSVLRSVCSGAITDRHYTEEAARRARHETRTLVFQ